MNQKPPMFRKHASGNYFCRWGGKDHYFGKGKDDAHDQYLKSLEDWAVWRRGRDGRRLPPMSKSFTVAKLVEMFVAQKDVEGGVDLARHYAKHLKRFNNYFGEARGDMVRASHVQSVKEEMIRGGYKPRTVNHDIVAIKAVMSWASQFEYIPMVSLKGVKTMPLGPSVRSTSRPERESGTSVSIRRRGRG